MKKIFSFLVAIAVASVLLFQNCSKKNNPGPPPPSGQLSITRISPDTPYVDDEITITGTGFGTDSTQMKVYWGSTERCSMLSISDTVMKVMLPPTIWFGLNNYAYLYLVKGAKEYTHDEYTYLKQGLKLVNVDNISHGTSLIAPDEIIEFTTIGGNEIFIHCETVGPGDIKVVNPVITENYYKKFRVSLPADFYGTDRFEDTATAWVDVIVKEGGKKSSKAYKTRLMPETNIQTMAVTSDTWSLKALQTAGKALNFNAMGRNLYSRCYFQVFNKTSGIFIGSILFHNQPGQGIFYDEVNVPIPVNAGSGMGTGDYRVSLYNADDKWMGDATFTLLN